MLIHKAGMHLAHASARYWEQTIPGTEPKQIVQLREEEAEACIEAILLFQSGMEAIINEEITSNNKLSGVRKEREFHQKKVRDLSFKNKWEHSYKAVDLTDAAGYLSKYLEFYRDYRVPITHPKNRYFDVSPYTFPVVYHAFRNGWLAFMQLISTWEDSAQIQSWEEYCVRHNLPKEIGQQS